MMQYRLDPKSGNKLSALGFGCMRFPRGISIDLAKSEKLVIEAVEKGVNYFDTAYIYGGSEDTLGEILHKNDLRGKIYLATKLPHGKCKSYEDFDKYFNEQLRRLHTDYIDYYLIHNVTDMDAWRAATGIGLEKWIDEKKESGQIRQIGFSFHGAQADFLRLLDAYPWEFCQIQYNYMNENYQAGRPGLQKAHEMGLPVIIMEPLLGGKLASGMPKKIANLLSEASPGVTPAALGLKWIWDQPEATVVLSGMNAPEQLADNLKTAETATVGALTAGELAAIEKAKVLFEESYKTPCTGCNYCMPCPHNVNIPGCFAAYNASYANGFVTGMQQYMTSTNVLHESGGLRSSNCVKCGVCEQKCPQHIKIPDELLKVKKRMEPFWFNPLVKIARSVM
ncbi:MAG: aldo/keto reductase [Clostridiales Family XIII bacterium]|jgi:predicted aldo/keto reductase-like oxidoreductase|nr:aldo/keto reductase [Clostridiales Family XIII bacterium]